ncbi:MAG: hypothetical protein CMK36_02535 [Porticoccaceae bacterium]|nr:hypothetical protein [Porticoccaceae bacterium]
MIEAVSAHSDQITCQCSHYENRYKVKDCVKLDEKNITKISWLPSSCTYRLVANGMELQRWHHRFSSSQSLVHFIGVSIMAKVISEHLVKEHDLEDFVTRRVDW